MSEIEKLNELQQKIDELYNIYEAHLHQITNRLFEMLTDLNTGPAQLLPLASEETVGLEGYSVYDKFDWKIRKEINYVNQDPNSKSNYDFGSGFSLYITNNKIELNHGSCGTWGANDKGQLSRLYLMTHIFENEKHIIEELDPLVREALPVKKELSSCRIEIDRIERDIRNAKEQRENQEILNQLAPGKYICEKGYHWVWSNDDSGTTTSHREYHYYNFEKIEKITDKTIITTDDWGDKKWRKKDQYVYKLKNKYLYLIDSKDAKPEQPKEE